MGNCAIDAVLVTVIFCCLVAVLFLLAVDACFEEPVGMEEVVEAGLEVDKSPEEVSVPVRSILLTVGVGSPQPASRVIPSIVKHTRIIMGRFKRISFILSPRIF